jgi:hypothetical protein
VSNMLGEGKGKRWVRGERDMDACSCKKKSISAVPSCNRWKVLLFTLCACADRRSVSRAAEGDSARGRRLENDLHEGRSHRLPVQTLIAHTVYH